MTTLRNVRNVSEPYEFTLQQGSLSGPSARKVAVLMRMYDRIDLLVLSDLEGHARIIPKVGDQTADALSALISSGTLPDTSAIMVIHHTAGGMATSSNENSSEELSADTSQVGSLYCSDLERSVRDDVAFLKASPLIQKNIEITGLIYDVSSRNLSPVTSRFG